MLQDVIHPPPPPPQAEQLPIVMTSSLLSQSYTYVYNLLFIYYNVIACVGAMLALCHAIYLYRYNPKWFPCELSDSMEL